MSKLRDKLTARLAAGGKGLIVYLAAGYPDLAATRRAALAAAEAGADIIEIGIPFSDPIADGPVIQQAATVALQGGLKPADALGLVADLTAASPVPVALMLYINTILQYGPARFAAAAAAAGAAGLIVPDLPLEEAAPLQDTCRSHGLDLIQFIAPTSPPDRIARISSQAGGFLYCVSTTGVTGVQTVDYSRLAPLIADARRASGIPIAIGFGIGSPEAAVAAAAHADAVIVGSAVIERLTAGGPEGVRSLVASIRQALDEAGERS
ncbi:tryptophan synthase subunit alpha [Anaeroselena agilis]|uniref:Tryptophan synthase alpha chain n=1 Tax=Anaeroselena agilis TaxID=3063788 RepID=A0ABU3P1G4_9FIRM|nr:tryptophan synthase subunit alpha [Selenomonadales bacterium 4137-cl]